LHRVVDAMKSLYVPVAFPNRKSGVHFSWKRSSTGLTQG
jgi:hypothetical protein